MHTIKKKGPASKHPQEQEIETLMHRVTDLLTQYQRPLLMSAIVAAVVIIIAGGFSFMRSQKEQNAAPLLAEAYEFYGPDGATAPNYAKALELFRTVQKKYSGTMSAAVAQYYSGNCLASLGQAEEALKEYQSFISAYSGEKLLLGMVYQRMGYIQRDLGRPTDAIKSFEQAESHAGPGVSTVELARLYENTGNKAESQNKYKKVQEILGGTAWGIEAMGKVQTIAPAAQPVAGKEGK